MANLTKDDLNEILDAKLDPLIRIIEDHETILRGQSKRNGLIGDVNRFKWYTSSGFLALAWKAYDWIIGKNG
tara:strand:+ start:132 stop:347 length:216 start_codon:yes stop_codon:yes gene_type:complete